MLHTIYLIMAMCDSSGLQCDFEATSVYEGVSYSETVKECETELALYPLSQDAGCYLVLEETSKAIVFESVNDDRVLVFEQ